MYEAYWNLKVKPFPYRVEAEDLYLSKSLRAASLRLQYCIDNNAGAGLVVGNSGCGKSSLLRLLSHLNASLQPFVHLPYPGLSAAELIRSIAFELSGASHSVQQPSDEVLVRLHEYLRQHADEDRHPVIAFDEAHLLTNDVMNEVILPLLNFAEVDFALSFTVLLVGQPSLGPHVARNAQLRERIAVSATVTEFTRDETADYVSQQLQHAGRSEPVFDEGALSALYELSGGNPRRINRLCDMALLVGCSDQASSIGRNDILSLSSELLPAAA